MAPRASRILTFTLISGTLAATIVAGSPVARADDGDPGFTDPGVARISLLTGSVDVKRADSGDVVAASLNAPLGIGDFLSTRDDARAELELGHRTAFRVAPDSQIRFTRLDPGSNVAQLAEGTVEVRLFDGDGAHPEVDTPNATILPRNDGRYRVTVDADGDSRITVRSGVASVAVVDGPSQDVQAGTSVFVRGSGANAQIDEADAIAYDSFDAWNGEQDRREADDSYAYADDRYVGAGDLGRYGSWQDVPGYGEAWHPTYAADFAPYRDGRFAWEPYYGWTWVSAEPWGWAPYHYGRWFYANDVGWCWSPARYEVPQYRPALVAFLSFGGGGGFDAGFGNIGWVPLAPYEAFHPWWGRGYGDHDFGGGYGNRTVVNVTNVTNITNVRNVTIDNYRNIDAPGAIVAIGHENFVGGHFEHPLNVTAAQLREQHAIVARGVVPIVPTRANLAFGGGGIRETARTTSPAFASFATKTPVPKIHSFDEQRDAVRAVAVRTYPNAAAAIDGGRVRERSMTSPNSETVGARAAATRPTETRTDFAQRPATVDVRRPDTTGEGRPVPTELGRTSPWSRFDDRGNAATASNARENADASRGETYRDERSSAPTVVRGDAPSPAEDRVTREPRARTPATSRDEASPATPVVRGDAPTITRDDASTVTRAPRRETPSTFRGTDAPSYAEHGTTRTTARENGFGTVTTPQDRFARPNRTVEERSANVREPASFATQPRAHEPAPVVRDEPSRTDGSRRTEAERATAPHPTHAERDADHVSR